MEDPEAADEILIEIRRPRLIIESIVKARRPGQKRFEKSDIELFVEAAYEDADEIDEITIEEIVIDSIKLPEARQLMIILPENVLTKKLTRVP